MAPSNNGASLIFDFSRRAKLRVSGDDRQRFLNGQITNDIRKASSSEAIEACILNAKGKMNAHVFISAGAECFWVDADPALRDALGARLERYVIADDVQIADVSDQMSIFHVLASSGPELDVECRVISVRRFLEPGWDIWLDASNHGSVLKELSARFEFVNDADAESFRIKQGIPKWGTELTEEIIPIEANLESRTIDYEKGCYIGQEVISRMKMSGQTNKRLCGLVASAGSGLSPQTRLAERKKEVGWITSTALSDGREIALGYVKRGSNDIGCKLEIVGNETNTPQISIEIVPLPFR